MSEEDKIEIFTCRGCGKEIAKGAVHECNGSLTGGVNPKETRANEDNKIPMSKLVYSVLADDARCHQHGADKYGERNWRESDVKASTYEGAMLRHLISWMEGEDIDSDSGLSHLTHLRACCAVVLDAKVHGTFIDDRNRSEIINN
jgi:hypothetical protein